MEVTLKDVTIRDLVEGYQDHAENGVIGYGGRLDVRPPFQREFVYNDEQKKAVIDTVTKGFPLNVMYWAVREGDQEKPYEIIDGQQRTISICQYVIGDFSFNDMYYHNLEKDQQEKILDYELSIYVCSGTDSEKLDWFRVINIAGEKLTDQELRNAVYHGSWVTDAKRYFSRANCPAYAIGEKYLTGAVNRQDYLETAIKWISDGKIEDYMGRNQHKEDAGELWAYFRSVIDWVKEIFPTYRKEMKGRPWGDLYNEYKDQKFDSETMENRVAELMKDDEVERKQGIYEYLLTGKESFLSLRSFRDSEKRTAYEQQKGICPSCDEKFEIEEMEADHVTPWHEGGKTVLDNCQMLCRECNRRKGGR